MSISTYKARVGNLHAVLALVWNEAGRFVKLRLAAAVLLITIASALTGLGPVVLKLIVDRFGGATTASTFPLALLIGSYVLSQWFARSVGEIRGFIYARAERRMLRTLSERVFDADNVRRIVIGERLAAVMLDRKQFAQAASLLRVVSDARRRRSPDDWQTFATVARLGGALVGVGRYAEAEPLLITAYRGLRQRAQSIPDSQKSVLESASDSILTLYVAWRKPDKRLSWEREIESRE